MKKSPLWLLSLLFLLASCAAPDNAQSASSSSSQAESSSVTDSSIESSSAVSQESSSTVPESFEPANHEIVTAFEQLTFDQPLYLTTANDSSNNLFVVERTGQIHLFENNPSVNETTIFLDLSSKISTEGLEMGLLGLAFHPDFSTNGYFYVNYTTEAGTVISRFEADPATYEADMESEIRLMEFPQPYSNHNGGHITFGPDGYLYIGVGDGGGSGDPEDNAQDLMEIYGKLLRIDVDAQSEEAPYAIPEDNPFAGNEDGTLEEIYAYGLRNPWKFSFDSQRELLWLADVGQNAMEEINLIEAGGNYGWNLMEGTQEYSLTEQMDPLQLEPPIWEYDHSMGQSITGGYVYYGKEHPSLKGTYLYGDFVSGRIWALWPQDSQADQNMEIADTDLMISSFGLDEEGELLIVDFNGQIYRLQKVK